MMPPPVPPGASVPTYLVQSILLTLCCCFSPLIVIPGIVAIVYGSQVNGRLAAGDLPGAIAASRNAKTWCWISLGVGIVAFLASAVLLSILGNPSYPGNIVP
jgi:hypothetical protein